MSYSGRLTCQDLATGTVRWTFDMRGFPYVLRSADIDGDGKQEVLGASSSMFVYALNSEGKLGASQLLRQLARARKVQ